jgi:hypothetical protein
MSQPPDPRSGEGIGVRMHGVRLNLRCDNARQLAYTADLLGEHACEPWSRADLEVEGRWLTASPGDDARAPVFDVSGLDAYGKRMHVGEDVLVWTDTFRDKDLQLRFTRRGQVLHCDVAYWFRPSIKKTAKYADYEQKKYFDLVRYLVFFPIAWHLRRTRGWEMIHASAVASDQGAVLIAGPGGAGKTTTSIALVARAGMTLLTENLVFSDGQHVYPVCEPIRLTAESLRLLGESAEELRGYAAAGGLKHKTMFVPPIDPEPAGVRPEIVFLARFSSPGFARSIPPPVARELIRATNVLTLELNDFYWYAAALDLLWPPVAAARAEPLERLTATTPCYSLGIDRAAGVEPVVERILECLHHEPRGTLETQRP